MDARSPGRTDVLVSIAALLCVFLANASRGLADDSSPLSPQDEALLELRQTVASESFDELVKRLKLDERSVVAFSSQMWRPEDFELVLFNPRTMKLAALLAHLPRGQARIKSQTVCDRLFLEWQQTVNQYLDHEENPAAPPTTQSIEGVRLGYGSAVFALAQFANPAEIVAELRRAKALENKVFDRQLRTPEPYPGSRRRFRSMSFLDNDYWINVLAYSFTRDRAKNDVADQKLAKLLGNVPRSAAKVPTWNARTRTFDDDRPREIKVYHREYSPPGANLHQVILRDLQKICEQDERDVT
jgi:hypothetical protein